VWLECQGTLGQHQRINLIRLKAGTRDHQGPASTTIPVAIIRLSTAFANKP
jgi:hypothetical protein